MPFYPTSGPLDDTSRLGLQLHTAEGNKEAC